jgi:hypothetical protein
VSWRKCAMTDGRIQANLTVQVWRVGIAVSVEHGVLRCHGGTPRLSPPGSDRHDRRARWSVKR